MTEAASSRLRVRLSATAAITALLALLGCGGGDELAPPVPVAEGAGMATVSLGGVDLGQTPLVTAGIAEAFNAVVPLSGEAARFEGDPPVAALAGGDIAPDLPPCQFVVLNAADPSISYLAGAHFSVDFVTGELTALFDTVNGVYFIPDGTDVVVSYCVLEQIFTVNVGIAVATGDFVSLSFYNVPGGASGMRNTNVAANSAPPDGSFAFAVGAATQLTLLNNGSYRLVDDPAQNDATIISADLVNQLNPCMEGRVVALMQEATTREELLLEVNFSDPECP